MSLSEVKIQEIANLTFHTAYTMQQLAKLIHVSYREVYDFFRTKRAKSAFLVSRRPWFQVLEEADPKLSRGIRSFYKKWVQDPDVWVRLAPKGFDLITARANLKPKICTGSEPENRQQKRYFARKSEKQIFRKLNYPQHIRRALEAGELEPSDLPTSGRPGSAKYLALCPDKEDRLLQEELSRENSEFMDPGTNIFSDKNTFEAEKPSKPLPAGWTLASMMQNYTETHTQAQPCAFGAEGIPDEEAPLALPYSMDRMYELFDQAMYRKFDPFKLGKCGPERYDVVMKLIKSGIKNFGYTIDAKQENGKRMFIPNNEDLYDFGIEKFQDYLERTSNETLVLLPKKDLWGEPIFKPNANRFNNEEKRIQARIRFENIFGDASRKYKTAIMLTLTSGQWHRNIFEDTKRFQENWNKLITRLRKEAKDKRIHDLVNRNPEFLKVKVQKNINSMPGGGELSGYEFSSDLLTPHEEKPLLPFLEAAESFQVRTRTARRHEGLQGRDESDAEYFQRIRRTQKAQNVTAAELREAAAKYLNSDQNLKLPYLCVREFQRNGNVHYHVIIFGISWLKQNDEISRIWQEYGQGKITKINKIRWSQEKGYIWAEGQAPEDAKGRQPLEYLKKYLLKGQYAEKNPGAALLYWVFNSRFFTYSSSLLSDEHRPRPYISKGMYEYAGVCGSDLWIESGSHIICIEPTSSPPPLGAAAQEAIF